MSKRCHKAMSFLVALGLVSISLLTWLSESKGEEVLLKYKATVIEETKDYIIMKFYKSDIGLVSERGKPSETLPTQQNLGKISSAPSSSEPALSRCPGEMLPLPNEPASLGPPAHQPPCVLSAR